MDAPERDPRGLHGERLERAIEASLRRTFAPPAARGTSAARGLPADGRAVLLGALPWAGLAALAAALLLFLRPALRPQVPTPSAALARAETPPALAPAAPPERGAGLVVPDLERLYAEVVESPPTTPACISPEELAESEEDRREMLDARYGPDLRLKPEAAALLQGPFPCAEWPSGTIFSSLSPDTPSVLIAERSEHVECCVRVDLPPESPLRVFTWTHGGLHLTEVTPLAEPHLIELFDL